MNAETAATLFEAMMSQEIYSGCILCDMGEAEAGFKSVVVERKCKFGVA